MADDPECAPNNCKTIKERVCVDYYCAITKDENGNIIKREKKPLWPNQQDPKNDKLTNDAAACCASAKNGTEVTDPNKPEDTETVTINIIAKIWPSVLRRNVLTCHPKDCGLDNLKGYQIKISATQDPQEGDARLNVIGCDKKTKSLVTGTNPEGKTSSLKFPILLRVDDILKNVPKDGDGKEIFDQNTICNPITHTVCNINIPRKKKYGIIYNVDNDPIKNNPNDPCHAYFYEHGDATKDGITSGTTTRSYTINCANTEVKDLCSILECMDSGKKPQGAPAGAIVTYSDMHIDLVPPKNQDDTNSNPCPEPIPVGLTLQASEQLVGQGTVITGTLDIGVPCDGIDANDQDNNPLYRNPKIPAGSGGKKLVINGVPYIDQRTIVKLCRSKAPSSVASCDDVVVDPSCNCSSLTEEEYNVDYNDTITSNTDPKAKSQTVRGIKPKNAPVTDLECELYICVDCDDKLMEKYKKNYCDRQFNNTRECWVCQNELTTNHMPYLEFCNLFNSNNKDNTKIKFLGWYNELTYDQAFAQCSPSVICCEPQPAKTCFYSTGDAPDKTMVISFNLKQASGADIPLKNKNNNTTYDISFRFIPETSSGNSPIYGAKATIGQFIKEKLIEIGSNLKSSSEKSTISGCSCNGDTNNFNNNILSNIKNIIKSHMINSYKDYLSICKAAIVKVYGDAAYLSDFATKQKAKARTDILLDVAPKLMTGLPQELEDALKNAASLDRNDSSFLGIQYQGRETTIKNILDIYFNLDETKLATEIDNKLNNLSLDCNSSSITLNISDLQEIIISIKFPDGITEANKCKPYTLEQAKFQKQSSVAMTDASHCSELIDSLKEKNCCIKSSIWAEDAEMNENGILTEKNKPGKCSVIKPMFNKKASEICEDRLVEWNNKIYRGKVIRTIDVPCGTNNDSCECTPSDITSCNNYNPEGDPKNPGKDPKDPIDPAPPTNPNPEKPLPPKSPPCSKISIKIYSNGTQKSATQDIEFPVSVSILDGNGNTINITINNYTELDSLVNGTGSGGMSASEANLSKADYRTRILAKIFGLKNINQDTKIDTSGSVDCGEDRNPKNPKDPQPRDPEEPVDTPIPEACADISNSIGEQEMILSAINSQIVNTQTQIDNTINNTQKVILENRMNKLSAESVKIKKEIENLQNKLNVCVQNN